MASFSWLSDWRSLLKRSLQSESCFFTESFSIRDNSNLKKISEREPQLQTDAKFEHIRFLDASGEIRRKSLRCSLNDSEGDEMKRINEVNASLRLRCILQV